MFAAGCQQPIVDYNDFVYKDSRDPLVLRGIMKHKLMKRCWQDSRDFYYMDSGYFGNQPNELNPNGWKLWHRIVPNNLQHGDIIERPNDRWEAMKIKLKNWRKTGKEILVVLPDEKPCKFYGIDLASWAIETVDTIKKYTDRPVVVRERDPDRQNRQSFPDALKNAFAVVTFNSNAATESIMNGIPAFVMAPCHAAMPVTLQDLSQIEKPYYPSKDLVYKWACHLAYGQFHIDELKSGQAKAILES